MTISFKKENAIRFGVESAVVYEYLLSKQQNNEENKQFYFQNKYWAVVSQIQMTKELPFFSTMKIRRCIQALNEKGIVEIQKENKFRLNGVNWYHIKEQQ